MQSRACLATQPVFLNIRGFLMPTHLNFCSSGGMNLIPGSFCVAPSTSLNLCAEELSQKECLSTGARAQARPVLHRRGHRDQPHDTWLRVFSRQSGCAVIVCFSLGRDGEKQFYDTSMCHHWPERAFHVLLYVYTFAFFPLPSGGIGRSLKNLFRRLEKIHGREDSFNAITILQNIELLHKICLKSEDSLCFQHLEVNAESLWLTYIFLLYPVG